MYTVIIQSINKFGEVEWEEKITSDKSLCGAKNRATRWIRNNLFESDYIEIDKKGVETRCRTTWRIY